MNLFLFSKLAWVFGQPLSLAFILAFLAFVALLLGSRRTGMLSSFGSALILFLTLYTTLGTYLLQGLEERFSRPKGDPADLRCMIVLGGAFENEVTSARGGIEFNAAADRFVEALRLAEKFPKARILVSGGDGSISGDYEGDAAASARFFGTFGISADRLIMENKSRTTFENAAEVKAILKGGNMSDCLLITSAYHMPRSMGLFRKLDIPVTPWPTDYRTSGLVGLGFDFTQPSLNAQNMSTAIREWVGLAGYYVSGRTSAFYPAE